MSEENESETYWRECYRRLKYIKRYATRRKVRREMKRYRREAALERRIAALERQNAAHTMRVNGVIRFVNDGNDTWQHVFDEETESCRHCGYVWPCKYETIRHALLGLDDADMIECGVPSDKIEIAA